MHITDDNFVDIIQEFISFDIKTYVNKFVETTQMLPLSACLAKVGVKLIQRSHRQYTELGSIVVSDKNIPAAKFEFGAKLKKDSLGFRVMVVYSDSVAQQFGLCPDDLLIAINGVKLIDIEKQLAELYLPQNITLSYFRREMLYTTSKNVVTPQSCSVYYLRVLNTQKLDSWLTS